MVIRRLWLFILIGYFQPTISMQTRSKEVAGRKDINVSTMHPDLARDVIFMQACMYGSFSARKQLLKFQPPLVDTSETYLEHISDIAALYKSICADAYSNTNIHLFIKFRRYLDNDDLKELTSALARKYKRGNFLFAHNVPEYYASEIVQELQNILDKINKYRELYKDQLRYHTLLSWIAVTKKNRKYLHESLTNASLKKIVEASKRVRQLDGLIEKFVKDQRAQASIEDIPHTATLRVTPKPTTKEEPHHADKSKKSVDSTSRRRAHTCHHSTSPKPPHDGNNNTSVGHRKHRRSTLQRSPRVLDFNKLQKSLSIKPESIKDIVDTPKTP